MGEAPALASLDPPGEGDADRAAVRGLWHAPPGDTDADILRPAAGEGVVAVEVPCWLPWRWNMSAKGLLNGKSWGVSPAAGARPADTEVKPAASGARPAPAYRLAPPPPAAVVVVLSLMGRRLMEARAPARGIIWPTMGPWPVGV